MPAQINAELVAVNGADAGTGGRDDWDAPAPASSSSSPATGPAKWAGSVGAYYTETSERRAGGAGPDVVTVAYLIIDTAAARAAGVDTDDVLTFIDPAGVERTARAARIRFAELDGIPAELATTKLELEDR